MDLIRSLRYKITAVVTLLLLSFAANASHIFGLDFYYKYVSGNTYTVYLVVYGDCSGTAFSTLSSSSPTVNVYNNTSLVNTLSLVLQLPTAGVEVTPVCPAQINNTTCVSPSGTIPGIKKFVYAGNVTLPSTSNLWRFVFSGNMGGSSTAGRSNSITNIIVGSGGSQIQLTDTLNNTVGANNSAQYTTIPTPFYCINRPANFNPGAVDMDGDALVYNLAPGIDAGTGTSVTYISPYTPTAPLGVSTGLFSFSSSTGQLAFTPNIAQKALVVYNVQEYRGGVLVGTSQREMTVVVLTTCTNSAPGGSLSGASGGGIIASPTQFNICRNAGAFGFHINPTDPDGDTINMTVSGLPSGAVFNIVNNNTVAPLGTFSWNTTTVAPGNYTFFVTYQDRGCPLSNTQTVAYTITVYPIPTVSATITSVASCVAKARITINPGGITAPFQVQVRQGTSVVHNFTGVTGSVFDSLVPGNYLVRVYNAQGCSADFALAIASPTLPSVSAAVLNPLCPLTSSGVATITGSAGVSPYTYALGSGSYGSSGVFAGLPAGSYLFHVKDANQCVKDTTITFTDPAPIMVTASVVRPLCNGSANGSVTVTGFNSTAPYTYALGSGAYSSTNTFTGLAQGTYLFHIKNSVGCVKDTTITLTDSVRISGTVSISPILCNGGTGTVTVTAGGSPVGGYTYSYNASAYTTVNVFTFVAGTYSVHARDANLCRWDSTISLTQPMPVVVTHTVTGAACSGTPSGGLNVSASGGTPGYLYSIGGPFGTSGTFGSLAAGTYYIQVQDANGCTYYDTAAITQPSSMFIDSVRITQPLCNGGNNGSAQLFAHGGTPGYTYAIGLGAYGPSSVFSGLSAISYTLHVRDANNCQRDTTITVTQPTPIIPGALVRPSVCSTLANGKVTLSATGGTPGYTYGVGSSPYVSSPIFTPLASGSYVFHIKDSRGCIKDTTIIITDSLVISATSTITPVICFGGANGTFTVTGTGGVSPYTYALGTGAYGTATVFTGLSANSYTVHVRDNLGCKKDITVVMTQPDKLFPLASFVRPSCFEFSDGSISSSATGGTPPYIFSFNSGPFSATTSLTGLAAGTMNVRVRDANGCTHDTTFIMDQPMPVKIDTLAGTNIRCNGGTDGSVTIVASGGTSPYQYAINSGSWQSTTLITGLSAGWQLVHIIDSNNCAIDTGILLTQPQELLITGATVSQPSCEGFTDGTVTINVSGGTWPYQYSVDSVTFMGSGTFDSLNEGEYTFYIVDGNGCVNDTTVTLAGLPHITVDSIMVTPAKCHGDKNGEVLVTASGGVQPLQYTMSGNAQSAAPGAFTGLAAGGYTLVITDKQNCAKSMLVSVTQPAPLMIAFDITNNLCQGSEDKGVIFTKVTGGTAPYAYNWSGSQAGNTQSMTGLANGAYVVVVTDSNKCTAIDTASVKYDNCCNPFIPNAFTPNDDGNNDVFRIMNKGDMQMLEFAVYNRFGEQIFYTQNQSSGWDGTYKGIAVELGTYFYYARIICGNSDGKVTVLKGDVTLVR